MIHSTSLVVSATILFKAMNKIISQQRRLAIFSSYFCKNDFKRKLTYVFFLHASANTRNAVSENKNIQSYNDLRLKNAWKQANTS